MKKNYCFRCSKPIDGDAFVYRQVKDAREGKTVTVKICNSCQRKGK